MKNGTVSELNVYDIGDKIDLVLHLLQIFYSLQYEK